LADYVCCPVLDLLDCAYTREQIHGLRPPLVAYHGVGAMGKKKRKPSRKSVKCKDKALVNPNAGCEHYFGLAYGEINEVRKP
jgi:hypothetical protein